MSTEPNTATDKRKSDWKQLGWLCVIVAAAIATSFAFGEVKPYAPTVPSPAATAVTRPIVPALPITQRSLSADNISRDIASLRKEGRTDADILAGVSRFVPRYAEDIQKLRVVGKSDSAILDGVLAFERYQQKALADEQLQEAKARNRRLCAASAECVRFGTSRQDCATAGSYGSCMEIKMGGYAQSSNAQSTCNTDGTLRYEADAVPNKLICAMTR